MLLEFACAMDLVIANTMFSKDGAKKITYESVAVRHIIDVYNDRILIETTLFATTTLRRQASERAAAARTALSRLTN